MQFRSVAGGSAQLGARCCSPLPRCSAPLAWQLRRLPSREFAINQGWCLAAAIATDLLAWLQIHALDGELAHAEPKRLRHRILHTAARLARGQLRRWLRIPATSPWATPDHRRVQPDRGHRRTRLTWLSHYRTDRRTPGDHARRRDNGPLTMPSRYSTSTYND